MQDNDLSLFSRGLCVSPPEAYNRSLFKGKHSVSRDLLLVVPGQITVLQSDAPLDHDWLT